MSPTSDQRCRRWRTLPHEELQWEPTNRVVDPRFHWLIFHHTVASWGEAQLHLGVQEHLCGLLDPAQGSVNAPIVCGRVATRSGYPGGRADTVDVQWRHFEAPTLCWWPSTMRSGHRPRTQHGDGHGDSLVVYVGGPIGLQEGGPRRLSAVDRRQDDSLGPTIQQG